MLLIPLLILPLALPLQDEADEDLDAVQPILMSTHAAGWEELTLPAVVPADHLERYGQGGRRLHVFTPAYIFVVRLEADGVQLHPVEDVIVMGGASGLPSIPRYLVRDVEGRLMILPYGTHEASTHFWHLHMRQAGGRIREYRIPRQAKVIKMWYRLPPREGVPRDLYLVESIRTDWP